MIKLENVKKVYSEEVTIGPIDLEIPRCGITSIIGPNGAGKSTILLMMGRLLEMDTGSISFGDYIIEETPSEDLAKIIAILRQENHFVTRLTVRQLVGFGRYPYSKGRLNKEDEEIISRYIDFLGLKDLENRFLSQLSGGQRQRAYVAMVLAQDTDYVLLDEPLNNLDIARSIDMLEHLRKAADQLDKTIIMVVHDLNFVARYSDKVLAMKDGQLVDFGNTDDIIHGQVLSQLYNTQIEVIEGPKGLIPVY